MGLFARLVGGSQHSRATARQLNDVAVRHLATGQSGPARDKLRRAVAADPTWPVSHLNYARFLFAQREYGESARYVALAKRLAEAGGDPAHDEQVLRDARLLEGGLAAHGIGPGTVRQQYEALAAARGDASDRYAPAPNDQSKERCIHCCSKITRQAPVHQLLPHKELKGASQRQRDRWYGSLGRTCPSCGKMTCGLCYGRNGQKCPACGATMQFFTS